MVGEASLPSLTPSSCPLLSQPHQHEILALEAIEVLHVKDELKEKLWKVICNVSKLYRPLAFSSFLWASSLLKFWDFSDIDS